MGVPAEYFEDNMIVIRERFRKESDLRFHIYPRLKDMSAVERTVALEELRATLSPYIAITAPEVWGKWEMYLPTHITASYEAAVNNVVKATGQSLSPEDEKYLRIILNHNSGWGATYPEHMHDPWVTYIQYRSSCQRVDSDFGFNDLSRRSGTPLAKEVAQNAEFIPFVQ